MVDSMICDKLKSFSPYEPNIDDCKIHLDANESCMTMPESVSKKIAKKIAEIDFARYPDPLASEVCGLFGRRFRIPSRLITAGNGSDELISTILTNFTERGDKVLITEPDFSMYKIYCASSECSPVIVGKSGDLTFSVDEMINLANKEKVRLIMFSNPCNPTGQGINREEVLRIVKSVNCIVVVDEAYMDFWNQSVIEDAPSCENLIVLKTCSKIGFAAARLGFAISNTELTDYLRAAKSPYNVNSMTQAAATVFLGDNEFIVGNIEGIKSSRERLYKALKSLETDFKDKIKVFSSNTNFVLIKSAECERIYKDLKSFGISVRFMGSYLRITAGTEEENRELITSLKIILSK